MSKAKYNGIKNLITTAQLTEIQRKEMAIQGGKASQEATRKRKLMREILTDLLKMPIEEGELTEIKNLAQSKGKNLTVSEAILLSQVRKAVRGDTSAAIFIRDTAGQKPKEEIAVYDVEIRVSIEDDDPYQIGDC